MAEPIREAERSSQDIVTSQQTGKAERRALLSILWAISWAVQERNGRNKKEREEGGGEKRGEGGEKKKADR